MSCVDDLTCRVDYPDFHTTVATTALALFLGSIALGRLSYRLPSGEDQEMARTIWIISMILGVGVLFLALGILGGYLTPENQRIARGFEGVGLLLQVFFGLLAAFLQAKHGDG